MIDLSQGLIASLILYSFACGILLAVIYDTVRFVRYVISPMGGLTKGIRSVLVILLTFLTDFLFLLLFAVSGILIIFNMCGGVFRGSVYFALAGGILIYRITVGRLTARLLLWLAGRVRTLVKWIFKLFLILIRPIKKLFVAIYTLTIGRIIGRIKEKILIRRLARFFVADSGESGVVRTEDSVAEREYKKEGRISFGRKQNADR